MSPLTQGALAALIDHTLLKPEARQKDIETLCAEALRFGFASVCVLPHRVRGAAALLKGSSVKVGTVVGFPLGANHHHVKAVETEQAIADGATEIDMVLNIGALKERDLETVTHDVRAVVSAADRNLVKVILETCLLTNEEIVRACAISQDSGAHFVKTSTGFSTGGASFEHVALMRRSVGDKFGVKASGGIRDLETALRMIEAGANRIGTSSGVQLIQGLRAKSEY
jgi:deoxyribose-phosphate aldolase